MIRQFACEILVLTCLSLTCGQQYPLNYGTGYQPYPTAFDDALLPTENSKQTNNIIHTSSSNFGTHRPPLSVWSGAPIVVGYEMPAAGVDNAVLNYAAPPRDYSERTSDQLTPPAYLPTNLFNNARAEEFIQRRRQIDEQVEHEVTAKAANHRYDNEDDNVDVNVDNDYYNRQQQIRGLSRGRGEVHGQPELLAAITRSDLRQNESPYLRYGRVGAGSFYEPPLPLYGQMAHSGKFAAYFAEYLRKYPQRLQPIYDAANDIKK